MDRRSLSVPQGHFLRSEPRIAAVSVRVSRYQGVTTEGRSQTPSSRLRFQLFQATLDKCASPLREFIIPIKLGRAGVDPLRSSGEIDLQSPSGSNNRASLPKGSQFNSNLAAIGRQCHSISCGLRFPELSCQDIEESKLRPRICESCGIHSDEITKPSCIVRFGWFLYNQHTKPDSKLTSQG